MSRPSLFPSPNHESPYFTGYLRRVIRSRKPVTGFSPYEGSNPSLSV